MSVVEVEDILDIVTTTPLFTLKETARLLKFSKRQLQRWIRNKQLNVVRFGRAVRVSHEEIRRIKSIGIHDESADILRSEVGCRVKSRSRRKTGSLWE